MHWSRRAVYQSLRSAALLHLDFGTDPYVSRNLCIPESSWTICCDGDTRMQVYDARVLHRGSLNQQYARASAAIVFRYDFADTPPPGLGPVATFVTQP